MKQCRSCLEVKPLDAFHRSHRATSPGGQPERWILKTICKPCHAAQVRNWYARNSERGNSNRRRLQLKANYGLTPQSYADLLQAQSGVCAICGRDETSSRDGKTFRLSVDHEHGTNRVRGLLCQRCNRAIGLLGDDPIMLRKAISYLQRFSEGNLRKVGQ